MISSSRSSIERSWGRGSMTQKAIAEKIAFAAPKPIPRPRFRFMAAGESLSSVVRLAAVKKMLARKARILVWSALAYVSGSKLEGEGLLDS